MPKESAIVYLSKYLKDDPNPPTVSELQAFFKSLSREERESMARSIGWGAEEEDK